MLLPWLAVMAFAVAAIAVGVYQYGARSAPPNRGGQPQFDDRILYPATLTGMAVVGAGIAFLRNNRWRALKRRGRFAEITDVAGSLLGKSGMTPVRVSYVVEGRTFRIARDLGDGDARALKSAPHRSCVYYDPSRPGRAEILLPDVYELFSKSSERP